MGALEQQRRYLVPMDRSRRVALVVGAVVGALLIIAIAAAIYWRSQAGRLDDMQDAIGAFEPADEWVGWTVVDVTTRDYSPFCVDAECPSHSERYVAAVPDGDVGPALEAALEAMAVGPVLAPDRRCLAGERCLYTVDGDGYTMDVVLADPFDFDRGTVSEVPSGYVEVSITLHAF